MWGPDQSGHICHHAVFVGILTLLVSSKMVASRASPRSGFLPLSLVLVVTLVGRIAATDIDKNRTVSSIFPDLGALAALFSKTVDEFLNNTLSMFQNLPPNYKNTSTEVGDEDSAYCYWDRNVHFKIIIFYNFILFAEFYFKRSLLATLQ